MRTHQEIDRRGRALMRAVVAQIDADPARAGLERARATCARWMLRGRNEYLSQWKQLLTRDWSAVRAALLAETAEADALRQNNPFAGVLTPRERWAVYRRFGDDDARES